LEPTRTLLSVTAASTPTAPPSSEGDFPEVHQAIGMVMVQLDVDIATADRLLRSYAIAAVRSLDDVAHDIVVHRRRLDELATG
jgi:hypothetical protein